MKKVKVYVTLKEGVLDPQGKAIEKALDTMGHGEVEQMRVGKYMEFFIKDTETVQKQIETICHDLLSNPVIEDYRYEIEEGVSS